MSEPKLPEGWEWEHGRLGVCATRRAATSRYRCYILDGMLMLDESIELGDRKGHTGYVPIDVAKAVLDRGEES